MVNFELCIMNFADTYMNNYGFTLSDLYIGFIPYFYTLEFGFNDMTYQ